MKRALVLALAASTMALGCGDNSNKCGDGTKNVDGVCLPTTTCGPGTVDDGHGQCVVAPGDCKDGTVLIGNECVDPTRGLKVDVEEATEPNGLGVVENSTTAAGQLTLKATGETLVVHGHITPFRDADHDGQPDPDFDTYVLEVTGPTLVDISVDGVGGAMGAFLALADQTGPAAGWRRFGLNIANDTSKRQLYFPAAGTYAIAVGDTRSMFLDGDSPPVAGAGGAAGGPDAEYYMSITVRDTPPPMSLTIFTGMLSTDATLPVDKIDFYTVDGMGLGYNTVVVDMPQAQSGGAVVLLDNDAFRAHAIETAGLFGPIPASVAAGGIKLGDRPLIVVDAAYNYGPDPAPYTLTIVTGDATALSLAGGTVSQPVISSSPQTLQQFNTFFYDVSSGDELDGFVLHVNHPVDGAIADENLFIRAHFTFDPFQNRFVRNTFTDFKGLIRHLAPGRYYLVMYDPTGKVGTDTVDVTSTITTLTPAAVTENTPLTNQTVNAFNSMPFTYNAGSADPWQDFDVTGSGTGPRSVDFFDATTAYGTLDSITTAKGVVPPDPPAVFSHQFASAPSKIGRILLDDNTTSYFVTVNTANATGTVSLDFAAKLIHDFGTVDAGNMAAANAVTLDATTTTQFFLFRTGAGNRDTITATPITATLDTVVQRLNNDESALGATINNGAAGQPDSGKTSQPVNRWTAYVVTSATPLATAATFNTSAKVDAPITYNVTDTTTAFADACNGGTTVTLHADGATAANDDGLSDPITAPAGFQFFDFDAPSLIVSSNGFLSFNAISSSEFTNADMPRSADPNAVVAPYWDDLTNIVVCAKAAAGRLTIQWTGVTFGFGQAIAFQVILDNTDHSIEFVYGGGQVVTGAGATIGVEDQVGASAKKLGFNTAGAITPGAGKKLTPM